MGCIVLAFFRIDDGILYGGKSSVDDEGNKTVAGAELLGIQIFGCLMIALWSGGLSAIFFLISNKLEVLRLSPQDEILGGDIYYFAPIEFDGVYEDYDLQEHVIKMINTPNRKISTIEVQEINK